MWGKHNPASCKYKECECHFCGKKGHLSKVCKAKARAQQQKPPTQKQIKGTHQLSDETQSDILETNEYSMFHSTSADTKPYIVSLKVGGVDLAMEVDTRAALSVISEKTYNNLFSNPPQLKACSSILKTYTGEVIRVRGLINVDVKYEDQKASLNLIVTLGDGPSLLGRDWLKTFRLDWSQLNHVYQPSNQCDKVVEKHKQLLVDDLGLVQGMKAKFHIDKDAPPKFCKAQPVPYVLKAKTEAEQNRLENQGVIMPVEFSQWAAPIVPIVKGDGTI